MNPAPNGFRITGDLTGPRKLIDWHRAHAAYCAADPRAEPGREAYLSLFTFGEDFARHLAGTGSTRGYRGPCGLPYLAFDIDRAGDLDAALTDAKHLTAGLLETYRGLDDDDLIVFFSGAKGFHVLLPLPAGIEPSPDLPAVAKHFAGRWATHTRATIDTGIYDASRCFRAPNSRHPKTGKHKRRITRRELLGLTAARIVEMATDPLAFDLPARPTNLPALLDDWHATAAAVVEERAKRVAQYSPDAPAKLAKRTLALIRGEWTPDEGDRHRLLFSAAANLGECGCPHDLALTLLAGPGLDSGLTPDDVRRQVASGINHTSRKEPHVL